MAKTAVKTQTKSDHSVALYVIMILALGALAYCSWLVAEAVRIPGNTGLVTGSIERSSSPSSSYGGGKGSSRVITWATITYVVDNKEYSVTVNDRDPALRKAGERCTVVYYIKKPAKAWPGKKPRTNLVLKSAGALVSFLLLGYAVKEAFFTKTTSG
jgi:hypothetical protein